MLFWWEVTAVLLSLVGLMAVSYRQRWGWLVWIVSDSMWAAFFIYQGFELRGGLELIYTSQCVWAYWKWGKYKKGE